MPTKPASVPKTAASKAAATVKPGVRKRRDAAPHPRADRALTKRDLVMQVSAETEISQDVVHSVLQLFLDHMTEALSAGRHIEFRDFGVFELARRRSRIGRNPNRPEHTVTIPERKVVKFKPGKRMKALIAQA